MNDMSKDSMNQLVALIKGALVPDIKDVVKDTVASEITGAIDTAIAPLRTDITSLTDDVKSLKADVTTLKDDTASLKTDVGTLKADTASLKADVGTLKADTASLKEDSSSLKADSSSIKLILGSHSLMLGELRADMRSAKTSLRTQGKDLHRLNVLFEDLDDRFYASAEAT